MDTTTLLRRVKRDFGDEYGIIITDQDIFDWANEGQAEIIRETGCNETTVVRAANTFPVGITDKVRVKRVSINGKAMVHTTLSELDLTDIDVTSGAAGTPLYWYYDSGTINIWPTTSLATDVTISYSRLPTQLSLVAPYLQWQLNAPSTQLATIAADTDFDLTAFNATFELAIGSLNQDLTVAAKATNPAAPATHAWALYYRGATGNGVFKFEYSNGAATRITGNLQYRPLTPLVANEKIKFRIQFVPATGVTTLHRVNSDGSEILDATDTQATSLPFNISTTPAYPIVFGGANLTPTQISWRLYSVLFKNQFGNTFYEMDGALDLALLPTIPATPFLVKSGQTMEVTGDLQVLSSDNSFSIPENYHDALTNFCLSRAHRKNRNTREAEATMEYYMQGVSGRREDANTVDAPTYKGADPYDHGWDYDATYG